MLCSLSNFDAYTMSRVYRSPKPFTFALRSTDNLSMFENPSDSFHMLSCDKLEGELWTEKIMLARVSSRHEYILTIVLIFSFRILPPYLAVVRPIQGALHSFPKPSATSPIHSCCHSNVSLRKRRGCAVAKYDNEKTDWHSTASSY